MMHSRISSVRGAIQTYVILLSYTSIYIAGSKVSTTIVKDSTNGLSNDNILGKDNKFFVSCCLE